MLEKLIIKKLQFLSLICIALFFSLFNYQCSKKTEPDRIVLATVGNKIITVDDFQYNYEFGLPHLKQGPDRKLTYLNYMINEQLLAIEGYRLGLDETKRVQSLKDDLLEELLVEELFKKEVNEKINITPEEITDAISKSTVKWKLRYWVEPNPEYANSVCQAMRKNGYARVVSQILSSNPEVKLKPEDFDTDYLTWLDVSPELLDAIKALPLGEISDPLEMNGSYFIFQIVDIRREPLSDYEIQSRSSGFKKILLARKAREKAAQFVSSFMTPKNVVTKGDAFRILSTALFDWNKSRKDSSVNFLEAMKAAESDDKILAKLRDNLNRTLVKFEDGHWTIADFLAKFNVNSMKMKSQDIHEFQTRLSEKIAVKVRNHFFCQEAKKQKLHKSPPVKQQMQMWQDKWVYESLRSHYLRDLTITEDRVKEILIHKIDSLKTIYPVVINQAVLDTIEVADSEKSKWISVQVFKRSSNRMARPIVDPAWGF